MHSIGQDREVSEFRAMCLSDEDFEELCELYPNTREILKLRSLIKRSIFMRCMKKQEEEAKLGNKKLTTFIYKADVPFKKVK